MASFDTELVFATSSRTDILDITSHVREVAKNTPIDNGQVLLFIPGSTAALTTIEFEEGVVNDLRRAIELLAPEGQAYEHDARWGDGNGYAHVRAALLGPHLCIPLIKGHLALGTWQQIVLLDFDNRPRRRRVVVQIISADRA